MDSITTPFERLKERHIDRLLCEELVVSTAFAAWFANKVFGNRTPTSELKEARSTLSHNRYLGETDILLELEWACGEVAKIHIEDKISARPQPSQADRYIEAIEREVEKLVSSVLVAPEAWLRRHPREAARYRSRISFEEIASELELRADSLAAQETIADHELERRLRWRSQMLNGAIKKRSIIKAIGADELIDWNAAAAAWIDATNGLRLDIRDRQRSEGRNKLGRFFYFVDQLTPFAAGSTPKLVLKTASRKQSARVSIDVPAIPRGSRLEGLAKREGFNVSYTDAGTLIISCTTPQLKKLDISRKAAEQTAAFEEAAHIAQRLCEWWEKCVT